MGTTLSTEAPRWDPVLYLQHQDLRLRPALDLLRQVHHPAPRRVYDLGCGTGNITRILAQAMPGAQVIGVDASAEMLSAAAEAAPELRFERADMATWRPPVPADILFSNAALHWLPDHQMLLPDLVSSLAPGGILAVQMPQSWPQPSHVLGRSILAEADVDGPPLGPRALRERLAARPVADPPWYYDLLAPLCSTVDLWETEYLQVLRGPDPVLGFVSGTFLRPVEAALPPDRWARFRDRYAAALRTAYPQRADGTTLFPFRRLFLVATRAGA